MSFDTARLTLSRASMPQQYSGLGIRFERQTVAKIKDGTSDLILLRPAGGLLPAAEAVGLEPRFNLLVCGLSLKTGDGTLAQGSGQLVITGRRIIGMVNDGSATGSKPLNDTSGNVFCFSFGRGDVGPIEVKRRRVRPSDYSFRSRDGLPVAFMLTVFSAMAAIANGKTSYWHDRDMDRALSEEGAANLLAT